MKKNIGFAVIVPTVLTAFFLFWILKINGFFDYSHKYHIRNFESERDTENLASMLDDEELTTWGDLSFWGEETVPEGEELMIWLDGSQRVSGLSMQGEFPAELSFYALSSDGKNWEDLSDSGRMETDRSNKVFAVTFPAVETEAIRIKVTKSSPHDRWVIGEMELSENHE